MNSDNKQQIINSNKFGLLDNQNYNKNISMSTFKERKTNQINTCLKDKIQAKIPRP
jgi:hypothetical protein